MELTAFSLHVNGVKIYQPKAKDSEIEPYPLYSDNISKDFAVDNVKKNALSSYVNNFSVDSNAIDVSDICKYLKIFNEQEL